MCIMDADVIQDADANERRIWRFWFFDSNSFIYGIGGKNLTKKIKAFKKA